MLGMDARTGRPVAGVDRLRQSIVTILTTRIGTRVRRRDFGSRIPALIDSPVNDTFRVEVFAAAAEALRKWEKEFRLETVALEAVEPGKVTLFLRGLYLPEGRSVSFSGIEVTNR